MLLCPPDSSIGQEAKGLILILFIRLSEWTDGLVKFVVAALYDSQKKMSTALLKTNSLKFESTPKLTVASDVTTDL